MMGLHVELGSLLCSLAAVVGAVGLSPATRDQPISTATNSLYYLDGTDWTATSSGRLWRSEKCTYATGIDYNPNASHVTAASSHYYMDQAACCRNCGSTYGCVAAVFKGTPCPPFAQLCRGHCRFRTTADLQFPVNITDNETSVCTPIGLQQTQPITIGATVPGVRLFLSKLLVVLLCLHA